MKLKENRKNVYRFVIPRLSLFRSLIFWIAVLGIAVYLFFFFATPFEPYAVLGDATPTRFSFFTNLIVPDIFLFGWLGPEGEFSLLDRIPILLISAMILLGSGSWGTLFLSFDGIPSLCQYKTGLTRLEFFLFSTVVGLSCCSLLIFWLGFSSVGLSRTILLCVLSASLLVPVVLRFSPYFSLPPQRTKLLVQPDSSGPVWLRQLVFFLVLPLFTVLLVLGGMIPSTDYDVLSYHFAGARTFFEQRHIVFQPHNAYANMPFGAEMFAIWGMSLTGNFFMGALVGKTLIALTTPLTALGLYALARRHFSESAGLLALTFYISTPWIVYVSTTGLIDSVVGMYAFFALSALLSRRSNANNPDANNQAADNESRIKMDGVSFFLAGFFAGSAAACKYPALLFVVMPLGVYLLASAFRNKSPDRTNVFHRVLFTILIYSFAVLLACGGWYYKNFHFTGNPVYPLCYSVFGDSTGSWTSQADARWTQVHRAHGFGLQRLVEDIIRVGATSPWNGPLIAPLLLLLPFVHLTKEQRRIVIFLLAWLLFLFGCWWFLTHRIDRFWLPAVPILSLLAGIGACWNTEKRWKIVLAFFLTLGTSYCFLVSGSPAPGKTNQFLAPLHSIRHLTPWATYFNEHPPRGQILLIGEAKAFLYDVPVVYNTCFNETMLRDIIDSDDPAGEFRRRDIEFILIDWSEIRRFRSPGNYGFTEFVQPEVFQRLLEQGVLEPFCPDEELQKSPVLVYRVRKFTAKERYLTAMSFGPAVGAE